MTREEAILYMTLYRQELVGSVSDLDKDIEAYDMAIDALKQELYTDTVSRQIVKEQMIRYGFHAPDMTVTEFVEDLPPVAPTRFIEEIEE